MVHLRAFSVSFLIYVSVTWSLSYVFYFKKVVFVAQSGDLAAAALNANDDDARMPDWSERLAMQVLWGYYIRGVQTSAEKKMGKPLP